MTTTPPATPTFETSLKAAQQIMAAKTHDEQRSTLDHWSLFVPFGGFNMTADEGEVAYVERCYSVLRAHAFEWTVVADIHKVYALLKESGISAAKIGEGITTLSTSIGELATTITDKLADMDRRLKALEQSNGGRFGSPQALT